MEQRPPSFAALEYIHSVIEEREEKRGKMRQLFLREQPSCSRCSFTPIEPDRPCQVGPAPTGRCSNRLHCLADTPVALNSPQLGSPLAV